MNREKSVHESKIKANMQELNKQVDNIQKELKRRISFIENAVHNKLVTQEEVMSVIQNEITMHIKEKEIAMPIYMNGIILYFTDGDFAYCNYKEEIEDLLEEEQEYEWNETILKSIIEFKNYYNLNVMESSVNPQGVIINFDKTMEMYRWAHRRNDEHIIDFIYNLNYLLEEWIFDEYTIF